MDDLLRTLSRLYEGTSVLVVLYDTGDRLCYANQAFRSACNIGQDDMRRPSDEAHWPYE